MNNRGKISITMDGKTLTGHRWTTPMDYDEEADQANLLRSLKGATPVELPTLSPTDRSWRKGSN
ncbi:MAG: hypothetical protein GXX96_29520 [Planctomycetaceae bacterium]|nr:hypothetical protein [Planctomycetaceae bacterium]